MIHWALLSSLMLLGSTQTNHSCSRDCCASLADRPPMTYYFYQDTGRLHGGEGEYSIDTLGYSGQKEGYLNPDYQCVEDIGPLPASTYVVGFCKNIMHQVTHRPCSFYLLPTDPSQMCGRDNFFIHGCSCCTEGDSQEPPSAGCSAGCIVIKYEERLKIRVGDTIVVEHHDRRRGVRAE